MIGNDIVDLALAKKESNWQREGFLDKIFTSNEQKWILSHDNPEVQVWDLWSRKEAVYKIYNRQSGIRSYIPLQIECLDFNSELGKVKSYDTIYFTKTEITPDFIHSVAVLDKNDFQKIISIRDLELSKIEGIPFYQINGELKPASKSNHGRFERIVSLV